MLRSSTAFYQCIKHFSERITFIKSSPDCYYTFIAFPRIIIVISEGNRNIIATYRLRGPFIINLDVVELVKNKKVYLISTVDRKGTLNMLCFVMERFFVLKNVFDLDSRAIVQKASMSQNAMYIAAIIKDHLTCRVEVYSLQKEKIITELEKVCQELIGRGTSPSSSSSSVQVSTISLNPLVPAIIVKPPSSIIEGFPDPSLYHAMKSLNIADVFGPNQPHMLDKKSIELCEKLFFYKHKNVPRTTDLKNVQVRLSLFRFIPIIKSPSETPINMFFIMWTNIYFSFHYVLDRKVKDSKPDKVWSSSSLIITSLLCKIGQLHVFGFRNGILCIVSNKTGYVKCLYSLYSRIIHITSHVLKTCDICQERLVNNHEYLVVSCKNGSFYLINIFHGNDAQPKQLLINSGEENSPYIDVFSCPGYPSLFITVQENGKLQIHDIFKSSICGILLPEPYRIEYNPEKTLLNFLKHQDTIKILVIGYIPGVADDDEIEKRGSVTDLSVKSISGLPSKCLFEINLTALLNYYGYSHEAEDVVVTKTSTTTNTLIKARLRNLQIHRQKVQKRVQEFK